MRCLAELLFVGTMLFALAVRFRCRKAAGVAMMATC